MLVLLRLLAYSRFRRLLVLFVLRRLWRMYRRRRLPFARA
jgi:hypothetical protein